MRYKVEKVEGLYRVFDSLTGRTVALFPSKEDAEAHAAYVNRPNMVACCPRVARRIPCKECGYPPGEAMYGDYETDPEVRHA